MKLANLWSMIGITTMAIAAHVSINKHDVQAGVTARDPSVTPSPRQTREGCVARCKDDSGRLEVSPPNISEYGHGCLEECSRLPDPETKEKTDNPDETQKTNKESPKPEKTDKPKQVDETGKTGGNIIASGNAMSGKPGECNHCHRMCKLRMTFRPWRLKKCKKACIPMCEAFKEWDKTSTHTNPEKSKHVVDSEETKKLDKEHNVTQLVFKNDTEWTEWLKEHKKYEEVTPP